MTTYTQEYINTIDKYEIEIAVACAEGRWEDALHLEGELKEMRNNYLV